MEREVELREGDVSYLPRRTIHQACALEGRESLHITLTRGHLWTWADLLGESLRVAAEEVAVGHRFLRESLLRRFGDYFGSGFVRGGRDKDKEKDRGKKKRVFVEGVGKALDAVEKRHPMDTAGDRMMLRFMRERLPPPSELINGAWWVNELVDCTIDVNTRIKVIADGVARTVSPGEKGNHTH